MATLNSRNELQSESKHQKRHLLSNLKINSPLHLFVAYKIVNDFTNDY